MLIDTNDTDISVDILDFTVEMPGDIEITVGNGASFYVDAADVIDETDVGIPQLTIEIPDADLLDALAYRIGTGASSLTLDDVYTAFDVVPAGSLKDAAPEVVALAKLVARIEALEAVCVTQGPAPSAAPQET